MRRYLLALIMLWTNAYAYAVTCGAPAIQLTPPQANVQIFQDVNGYLCMTDNQTASVALANLKAPNASYALNPPAVALTTNTLNGSVGNEQFTFNLSGTNNAAVGSVLIATTAVSGNLSVCVSTMANDQTNVVGIALAAATPGSTVLAAVGGFVMALTTGTVLPGTILVTTNTSMGYLSGNLNSVFGAQVGVALSSGPVGGLTAIKLRL